jgi:hypothetical protein
MLSNLSRALTYLTALLYAVLGLLLFLLPEVLAPVFAWKVSAFVTMTIGGWCLGNAWLAFLAARRWRWDLVYSALIYLWLFGVLEALVLVLFISRLQPAHPIAWLYLAALGVNILAAVAGVIDYLRLRPALAADGPAPSGLLRGMAGVFILGVAVLGYYGLSAQIGDPGTNGGVFPEVISLFTLRSLGAFYLCLALGVVPLLWAKSRDSYLSHGLLSTGFLVFITIAAFAYWQVFDVGAHPTQWIYLAAYLVVGAATGALLWRYGTGSVSETSKI